VQASRNRRRRDHHDAMSQSLGFRARGMRESGGALLHHGLREPGYAVAREFSGGQTGSPSSGLAGGIGAVGRPSYVRASHGRPGRVGVSTSRRLSKMSVL
jgi:hypothetical protein